MSGGFSNNTSESWLESDVSIPPQYLPLYQQYLAQKNLPGNQNLDPATFIASAAAAGHVDTRVWAALGLGQSNLGTSSTNNTYNPNESVPPAAAPTVTRTSAGRVPTSNLQLDGSSCHEVFFLLPVQVESVNADAHLQPSHTGARISMALWERVKTPLLPCKDDAIAQAIQSAFPIRVRGTTKLNVYIEGVAIVIENAMVFEGQTPVESLVLGIDIMHSAGIIWDIAMSQISILPGRVQPRLLSSFERLVSSRPTRDMLTAQAGYPNTWNATRTVAPESTWSRNQRHQTGRGAYQHGSISSSRRGRSPMPRHHDRSPSVDSWSEDSPVSSSRRDRSPVLSSRRNLSPLSRRDRSPISSTRRNRSPISRRDRSPVSSTRRDRSPVMGSRRPRSPGMSRRDRSPVSSSRQEASAQGWRDRSLPDRSRSPGHDYRYSRDVPCYSPPWPSRHSRSPTSRAYSPPSSRAGYQRESRTSPRRDSSYRRSISPRKTDLDSRYSRSSISTTHTGRRSPSPTRKRRHSPSPSHKNRSSPSGTRRHTCSHKQRSRSSDRKTGSASSSYKSRNDPKLAKSDSSGKLDSSSATNTRSEDKSSDIKPNSQSNSRSDSNNSKPEVSLKDKDASENTSSTSLTPPVDPSSKTESNSELELGNIESSDSKAITSDEAKPQSNEAQDSLSETVEASGEPENSVTDSNKQADAGPGKVTKVKVIKKVAKVVAKKNVNSPLRAGQKRVITGKTILKPGGVRTKVVKKIITRVKKTLPDNKPNTEIESTEEQQPTEVSVAVDDSTEDDKDADAAGDDNDFQTASLDLEDISASEGEEEEHMEPDLEDVSSASETEMMNNMDVSSNKVLDDVSDTELPMSDDESRKLSSDAEKEEQASSEVMDQEQSGNEVATEDQSLDELPVGYDIKEETPPDDEDDAADSSVMEEEPSSVVRECNDPDAVPSSPGLKQECVDTEPDVEEPSSSTSDQECASEVNVNASGDVSASIAAIEKADVDVNGAGDGDVSASSVEKAAVKVNESSDADISASIVLESEGDAELSSDLGHDEETQKDASVPETVDVTVVKSEDTSPKTVVKSPAPRKARKSFPKAGAPVGKAIETITTASRPQRTRRGVSRGKKT